MMEDELEKLEFKSLRKLKKCVRDRVNELCNGSTRDQFLVFAHVPKEVFDILDVKNPDIPSARLSYDYETNELIARLSPCLIHEMPHRAFITDYVRGRFLAMGIPKREIVDVGETGYSTKNSKKQPDSGLKPRSKRPEGSDWPTLVIECGNSESLNQLRRDACWWLENSGGAVRIVILICIGKDSRIILEKWKLVVHSGQARTRAQSTAGYRVPAATAAIEITQAQSDDFIASDQLVLEFEEILLRPPVPPEHDLVLTKDDLQEFAGDVFA